MEKHVQTVNSLGRGLLILDLIHEHGSMGVTELSRQLGVNKSSAYRLLKTLEESGYVEQVGEGGKIELYVPAALGYGERGNQGIEPNSTLIFNVELCKVAPFVEKEEAETK